MVISRTIPLMLVLYAGLAFQPAIYVFAQSYNIEQSVISSSGGSAISANFGIASTMGQITSGIFNGNSYLIYSGFWAIQSQSPDGTVAIPRRFSLSQNYPNPFNSSTQFLINLPIDEEVNFRLYDILGRSVKNIHSGALSAGNHRFSWNGKNDTGYLVSSGIYYATFSTPTFHKTIKLTLLK